MKGLNKRLAFILLGIWIIVTGILELFSVSFPFVGIIMGILAIITGLLLLFTR